MQTSSSINFERIVQAFILLGVCGWAPGMSQGGFQMAVLDYGGPALFGASIVFNINREFRNWGIGFLILACTCTSPFIHIQEYPVAFIHVLAGCLAYYAIVSSVKDPRSLAKVLVFAGIINMFIAFFQKIGYDLIYTPDPKNFIIQAQHLSMAGLMGRNYHLGYFLAVTAPLAFYLNFSFGILYTIFAGIFIYIIGSFAVMLVFGIGLLFWLSRWISSKIMCFIIGFIGVGILSIHGHTILGKIMWRAPAYFFCLRESLINPFIGHGLGSFNEVKGFDSSFNSLFKLMYELGIIPMTIVLIVSIKYFKDLIVPHRSLMASITALLVYTLFHDTTIFSRLMILGITVLAIYEIEGLNYWRDK